jgi:hypothetical protein|tara:strand:+ start:2405 stop:2626 length:222 start_codon:yes stop_codon:yes gene_type:complete
MGQKLDFNIEDAGIKIDGVQAVDSSGGFQGASMAATKLTGTIASARLPHTITTSAPSGVGSTATGHIWFVYSS